VVKVAAGCYNSESAVVVLDEDEEVLVRDFILKTARVRIAPESLEITLQPGKAAAQALRLENTGLADMTWRFFMSEGTAAIGSTEGRGEWLYRSRSGVPMAAADLLSITPKGNTRPARPSAYRWSRLPRRVSRKTY